VHGGLDGPSHPEERDREQTRSEAGQGESSLRRETASVRVCESAVALVLEDGDDDSDCGVSSVGIK
jgi:hypothetical protein